MLFNGFLNLFNLIGGKLVVIDLMFVKIPEFLPDQLIQVLDICCKFVLERLQCPGQLLPVCLSCVIVLLPVSLKLVFNGFLCFIQGCIEPEYGRFDLFHLGFDIKRYFFPDYKNHVYNGQ